MGDEVHGITGPRSTADKNSKKRKQAPSKNVNDKKKARPTGEGDGEGEGRGGRLWACPFFQQDRVQHKACRAFKLKRHADVTQHLNRCHLQPIHCPKCGEEFSTDEERSTHIRQEPPCAGKEFLYLGATQDQMTTLRKGIPKGKIDASLHGKTPEETKWNWRYHILFPGSPLPNSPYLPEDDDSIPRQISDWIQSYKVRRADALARSFNFDSPSEIVQQTLDDFYQFVEEDTKAQGSGIAAPRRPASPGRRAAPAEIPGAHAPAGNTASIDAPAGPTGLDGLGHGGLANSAGLAGPADPAHYPAECYVYNVNLGPEQLFINPPDQSVQNNLDHDYHGLIFPPYYYTHSGA